MSLLNSILSIFAKENCVSTALFGEVCDACNGGGVNYVLMYAIELLIVGIGILSVVGILIFGLQFLTAGSNAGQVAKAKSRLRGVIIGLVTYVAMVAIVEFLVPGGIKGIAAKTKESCPEYTKTEFKPIKYPEEDSDITGSTDLAGNPTPSDGNSGGGNDDDGGGGGGGSDPKKDRLEIHFVSAGNYYDDTIILRNKDGAVLIDGGRMNAGTLLNYLKGIGVTKLNYMIGSHIEEDHVKVQKEIADKMPVGKAFYPIDPSSCEPYCNANGKKALVGAKQAGLTVAISSPGNTRFSLGKMNVLFIGTDRSTWGRDANYSSIVNLVVYGNTKFMLTGDKENICNSDNVRLLKNAARRFGITTLDVDVYKWPHHGNSNCSNAEFLREMSPKFVAIPDNGQVSNRDWINKTKIKQTFAKKILSNATWLYLRNYKYYVFVSDGNSVHVEYNKEPSYWASYWSS